MKLSNGDIAKLVEDMASHIQGKTVRSVWRDGNERYGMYLVDEAEGNKPLARVVMEISLDREAGRLVTTPAAPIDKTTSRERKRDSSHVLTHLRRHLQNATLTKIAPVEGERIVLIDFDARQDDGLESIAEPRLAIELTGKRTNLILMNEQNRILVVHRHGRGQGGRDLVAKEIYTVPEFKGRTSAATDLTSTPEEGPLGLNISVAKVLREMEGLSEVESRRAMCRRRAKAGLKRVMSRLGKLTREIETANGSSLLQREGELLKIYATQIPKKSTSFTALDEFEDPAVERVITLDAKKTVLDQVADRFKRAKKLERGRMNMEFRLGESEADRDTIQELLEELEIVTDEDESELDRIERKLRSLGCMPKEKVSKNLPQENQGPRKFTSSDGLTVLVGRSNRENDKLSLQIARGNDIFFHVRGCPGSHVIVRKPREKSVPLETLLDAATLAVHFSKKRGSGNAEVNYTQAKYVQKPKGAKAGLVRIANEKTLRPGVDPDRLKRLLSSLGKGD